MSKKQVLPSPGNPSEPTPEGAGEGSTFDPTRATIGARILHHRQAQKLTQEALSIVTKKLDPSGRGVSRPVIVGYEKGDTLPGAREIVLLADALDVTPSYLLIGRYDLPRNSAEAGQVLLHALKRFHQFPDASVSAPIEEVFSMGKDLDAMVRSKLLEEAREEALAKNQELHQARTKTKGK